LNCFLSPLSTQNKVEPIFFPLLWEFLFSIRPKEPHFAEAPRGTPSAGAFPLHTSPSARASITNFQGVPFEYFCKRTAKNKLPFQGGLFLLVGSNREGVGKREFPVQENTKNRRFLEGAKATLEIPVSPPIFTFYVILNIYDTKNF